MLLDYQYFNDLELDWVSTIFLEAIISDSPINIYEEKIEILPIKFNRHEIMHGIDVKYGTEKNFWKTFSLLFFVSELLYFQTK